MKNSIIVLTGLSGSGKTYILNKIISKYKYKKNLFSKISIDDYYHTLDKSVNVKKYNFDIPTAIDFKLLNKHLDELVSMKAIEKPIYDFKTHTRIGYETLIPNKIIIIEGLLSYPLFERMDVKLKVFVDTDSDVNIIRRIQRDSIERGRTVNEIIEHYLKTVKPEEKKILEYKKSADLIIKNNSNFFEPELEDIYQIIESMFNE